MNLGQLLGGAGVVGRSWREAEEAERTARQNQLAIEEQNRLAALKAEMARTQLGSFQPQPVPNLAAPFAGLAAPVTGPDAGRLPVINIEPPAAAAPAAAAPAAAAPAAAAPAAPAAAAPAAAAPAAAAPAPRPAAASTRPVSALPTTELTAAQFQALPQEERLRRLQIENDRRRLAAAGVSTLSAPAAAADIFVGGPYNAVAAGGTWLANQLGVPRIGRALGIYDPDVTSVEIPRIGTGTATPYYDMIRQQQAAAAPMTEAQFLEQLKQQDAERTRKVEAERGANVQRAEEQGLLPWQLDTKGKPIRGLVNNNPGNIRPSPQYQWEGQVGVDKGEKERAGFVRFATPEAGIRAMTINLLSYDQQGINTVRGIINRWAPSSDQPGKSNANYVRAVAEALGVQPSDTVNVKDPATMQKLVTAMIQFENGKQPYSADVLTAGITAGLNRPTTASPAGPLSPGQTATVTGATMTGQPYNVQVTAVPDRVGAAPAPAAGVNIPGVSSAQAATAPTPAAAASAADGTFNVAVTGVSTFWLANPQSIPYEQQRLNQSFQQMTAQAQQQVALLNRQRNETAQLAQIYMRSGTAQGIEAASRLRGAIDQYDTQMLQVQQQVAQARQQIDQGRTYLEGMQGLQEFALANDPRRLASVWSLYAGVPIGIQPRTDGKFNVMVNGRKTKEGVSADELTNSARLAFDQTYRQQQAAAGAEYNKERFKTSLKIQENQAQQLAQMIREVAVQRVQGNTQLALEQLKQFRYDVKPTGAGDGTVIITPPGASTPYLFNPTGRTIEIDGVKIQSNAAYPIAGLPSYGGQAATTPTR